VPATDASLPDGLDPEAHGSSRGLYTEYMPVESDGEEHDEREKAEGLMWVCEGPIAYAGRDVDTDIANLRSALEGVDVVDAFIPCVAPASVYWIKNEHYRTDEEFVYALADALRVEYRRIHDAGIMVHVDDAVLWHMFGTIRLRGGTPEDYRRWAQPRVDALNHALEGIPADRVRYHICSGSDHSAHTQDPLLRDVIDMVLQVNARYLLIEQGNARHEHEWRIWEDVALPDDKVLVPGVVTHQTMMVEHPELVAQRLVRLAGLVGRERVMAGTDCGFAQTATTKRVPPFTQWAKLRSMVEGAQIATRELWPARVIA
jgi:5-methyltetrahydropteroyltriglutamate--homocysteine methyltransferase